MTRHHESLSPSSFPALYRCAAYKASKEETENAARGRRIHEILSNMLQGKENDTRRADELDEGIWAYQQVKEIYGHTNVESEKEVTLIDNEFKEVTFGTLDVYADGKLADLKTGQRKWTMPQMAVYALAKMDQDGLDHIQVYILWSKTQEIETYSLSREQATKMVFAIVERVRNKFPATPNEFCSWCEKKEMCVARIQAAAQIPLNLEKAKISDHMVETTPFQRAELLEKIKIAKKWCEDATEAIETWFLSDPGKNEIEGYELGESKPNRKWINELEALSTLKGLAEEKGIDSSKFLDFKLMGITEVKKIFGTSKKVAEVIDALLMTPPGKPSMIKQKDKK